MINFQARKQLGKQLLMATAFSVGAFAVGLDQPANAEASAAHPMRSTAQLNEIARDPSVGARALSVTVVGNGPAVTVLAEEKETAADKDLKIDAVFLAKALVEGAPGQIEKVKVLFSQSGKPARHITVMRQEIIDYGSGKLAAKDLLESLPLVSVQADNMPDISDGPEVERRLLAWKRIDKLRSQGTGVSPFEAIFKEIQGLAKANDADKVAQRLTYLESKLTGQEEQVKQARDSLRGRGVPAIRSASSSTSSAPGQPGSAQAGGGVKSAAAGYIPPEAEHLKATFTARSAEIVTLVMAKNSTEGFKVRDMKTQIDRYFASHEDAKAFEMLKNFDQTATKVLGSSMFGPGAANQGGGGNGGGNGGGGMGPGGGGMGAGGGMGPGGGGGMGPGGGGPPF